jgi:hypothetical protein
MSAAGPDDRGWVLLGGEWRHRPWWKVAINSVLRALQPFTDRKLVIATVCIDRPSGGPPLIVDYQLRRVRHLPRDTEKR